MQHRVFLPLGRRALARHALLLGLACGCSPAGSDGAPCQKDTDCKGDRLCGPDGMCIDPGGTTSGATTSAPTSGGPDATTGGGATSGATTHEVTSEGVTSSGGPSTGDTAGTGGGAVDFDNACACEACGGHGTCVLDGDAPSCQCDPGYVAAGLDCTPAPGSFGAT